MILTSQYTVSILLLPILMFTQGLDGYPSTADRLTNSQSHFNNLNQQYPDQRYLNQNFQTQPNIIGYNCAKPKEITTISLIDIGECDIKPDVVNVTRQKVRLLQRMNYQSVEIFQCKVVISRHVHYCGSLQITSSVENGDMTYLYDISRADCMELQRNGTFRFSNYVKPVGINNATKINSVMFAGNYTGNNWCHGSSFVDEFGSWDSNVVVDGTVTVTLRNMRVVVQLSSQKISLPSGQRCNFKDGYCVDNIYGHTFWDTLAVSDNDCKEFGILNKATVDKIVGPSKTVYTFVNKDVSYALEATKKTHVCNTIFIETLHPRLLIWEDDGSDDFDQRLGKVQDDVENLDVMSYVNAKFLYLDYILKNSTTAMYNDMIQKQCELEKRVLQNKLMLANKFPDHFGMHFKNEPGYLGTVSGEVVHITRCAAVEVKTRETERCYTDLPVTYNNQPYFLSPITHILKTVGTEVLCNDILATMYQLNKQWYKVNPKLINLQGGGPIVLQPHINATWKYERPQYLGSSGIYSNDDLEKLRDRLMHGVEQPPLLSDLAKDIRSGGSGDSRSPFNLEQLLREQISKELNVFQRMWHTCINFLKTLGKLCALFYGIFIFCHIIKALILLVVEAFALKSIRRATQYIFKTIGQTIIYFASNIFLGPSIFVKQEQKRQEIEMIKKRKKLKRDKLNNDSNGNSDEDVKKERQLLHKESTDK